jgi:hypothetical protein
MLPQLFEEYGELLSSGDIGGAQSQGFLQLSEACDPFIDGWIGRGRR